MARKRQNLLISRKPKNLLTILQSHQQDLVQNYIST